MSRKRSEVELGHDSFLDIVANLVGILIILVVVLGTQSTAAIQEMTQQEEETLLEDQGNATDWASNDQLSTLAKYSMQAVAAQADSDRFETRIKRYDAEIEIRKQQRAMLLDLMSEAEAAWADKKMELDETLTRAAEQQSQLAQAQSHLQQLNSKREQLENQPESVVAVAHLPTPMAKTVFGTEVHFRLKENRLSLVPIDKLLREVGQDVRRSASPRDDHLDAAVGPIQGYVASYVIDKEQVMVARDGRVGIANRVSRFAMKIEPLHEPYGQTLEEVFAPDSELQIELAGRDTSSTTITVWVYPDSFGAYRKLKEYLYVKGFATAARPLPMDQPIIGSDHGSRSSAQ